VDREEKEKKGRLRHRYAVRWNGKIAHAALKTGKNGGLMIFGSGHCLSGPKGKKGPKMKSWGKLRNERGLQKFRGAIMFFLRQSRKRTGGNRNRERKRVQSWRNEKISFRKRKKRVAKLRRPIEEGKKVA